MNKVLKYSLIGVGAATVITIAVYISKQASLLKDACYMIAGAIIHELSFNSVRFTLLLNVKNKSDLDVVVTNQRYNVYVNGMLVSKVDKKEKNEILANGKSQFKIDVQFNPQDLLRAGLTNIETLLYDKERLIIELKGYLTLKSGIITVKDYPVEEKLSLKELMAPEPEDEKC